MNIIRAKMYVYIISDGCYQFKIRKKEFGLDGKTFRYSEFLEKKFLMLLVANRPCKITHLILPLII